MNGAVITAMTNVAAAVVVCSATAGAIGYQCYYSILSCSGRTVAVMVAIIVRVTIAGVATTII